MAKHKEVEVCGGYIKPGQNVAVWAMSERGVKGAIVDIRDGWILLEDTETRMFLVQISRISMIAQIQPEETEKTEEVKQ